MSASAATPASKPLPSKPLAVGSPETLLLYRDDGPIAHALAPAGRAIPLPAFALVLLAVLPLFAVIAIDGDGASNGLALAVVAWAVLVAGASRGARDTTGLRWLAPPLLRAAEYGGLIWLASLHGGDAVPGAYAVIAACAFRHYDLVYRLRTRAETPPAWLNTVSGGWEGRLLVAWLLLALGALPAGLFVLGTALGILFAVECVSGWRQFLDRQRGATVVTYEDEEDETL